MIEEFRLKTEKGYAYAIYLLSLKLRTQGELREKMKLKKYESKVIDLVIYQLEVNKYIDDQRYAEVYLDNLKKYKTFGFFGIKKKLMEKRLPMSLIEAVLLDGLAVDEEMKIAKKLIKKLVVQDTNKIAQRMKSRGFRGEVISKVIKNDIE